MADSECEVISGYAVFDDRDLCAFFGARFVYSMASGYPVYPKTM